MSASLAITEDLIYGGQLMWGSDAVRHSSWYGDIITAGVFYAFLPCYVALP